MKIRVLVDNNTLIDRYYYGEPGLSLIIEDGGKTLMLDTGYTDIILKNAELMGFDFSRVDTLVFSHGHDDHTRGFKFIYERMPQVVKNFTVVGHPEVFADKRDEGENADEVEHFGTPYRLSEMEKICGLALSREPFKISDNITFLGEIPTYFDFEERYKMGLYMKDGKWEDDYETEDSALVYQGKDGIFVITGCSHSGICNIVEHAKRVTGCDKVLGVIGGFHMFKKDERLAKTIEYLQGCNIKDLYPCHCVSFKAKAEMYKAGLPVHGIGVGVELEVE